MQIAWYCQFLPFIPTECTYVQYIYIYIYIYIICYLQHVSVFVTPSSGRLLCYLLQNYAFLRCAIPVVCLNYMVR